MCAIVGALEDTGMYRRLATAWKENIYFDRQTTVCDGVVAKGMGFGAPCSRDKVRIPLIIHVTLEALSALPLSLGFLTWM